MSKGVNKVFLLGNVGRIESKATKSGSVMVKASLATTTTGYQNGEKVDMTEWHNLIFFGKVAEIADQYVKKGDKLHIEGKLQTNQVEKDGGVSYFTNIVVREMQMLNAKGEGQKANQPPVDAYENEPMPAQSSSLSQEDLDAMDEIPF